MSSSSNRSVMQQLAPYMMLGTQLAATILFLGGVGWLSDNTMDTDPWGLVVGLSLGSVVGFYQFLRNVQRLLKRDEEQRTKEGT